MKNILVLSGSPRKGDSHRIIKRIEQTMHDLGDVTFEYITLRKLNIEYCRGCLVCMKKGEDHCPLKDDMPMLREKMRAADGIVFASPVYIHTMAAPIKNLFDRMAYYLHRPCFHDKFALLVSTTELSGMNETLKHLAFPVKVMGFNLVDQLGVIAPAFDLAGPYREQTLARITKTASDFYFALEAQQQYAPKLSDVMFFNKLRTKITMHKEKFPADYAYWQDKDWFGADYFYPAKINVFVKTVAGLPVKMIKTVLQRKLGKEAYLEFAGLTSGGKG